MDGKEYLRSQLIIDAVRFQYVVPHPASTLDKASPFQLISPGVAETAGAFRLIAELPQGASELVNDGQDIAAMRIAGQGYSVLPIQLSSLKMVLDHLQSEIVVVLSMNEAIAAAAAEIIKTATYPYFMYAELKKYRSAALRDHCLTVAAHWQNQPTHSQLAQILIDDLVHWTDPLAHVLTSDWYRDRQAVMDRLVQLIEKDHTPPPASNEDEEGEEA